MKDFIKNTYGLELESLVRVSPKAYRLQADGHGYLLKLEQKSELELVIKRLEMLGIDTFVLPVISLQDEYIVPYEDTAAALYPYYEDDSTLHKDIRIHFYIKSIAFLHSQSSFRISGTDSYFEETIDYLEDEIKKVSDLLTGRIRRVEKEAYHSPADWFFLTNYARFQNALSRSQKYLRSFEDAIKEEQPTICLTYRNFDYRHIIVKRQKIVSIDRMTLAPAIYDLFFLFDESFTHKLDSSSYLREYLDLHPLSRAEIFELLTFLYIPQVQRMPKEKDDIEELGKAFDYLRQVEKAASILLSDEE